jgi:predicted RNA-binding Zn-ribbon protein involved in translation (DUF1610 family)
MKGEYFFSPDVKNTRTRECFTKEWGLMAKKMKCPNCGRRAFDISKIPKEEVEVTLKCPQCGKFVSVLCNEESEMKAS